MLPTSRYRELLFLQRLKIDSALPAAFVFSSPRTSPATAATAASPPIALRDQPSGCWSLLKPGGMKELATANKRSSFSNSAVSSFP